MSSHPVDGLVSVELAGRLRSAGLTWKPSTFDHFHIPDHNLDDQTFVIADLSVDIQVLADGIAAITFNGAVEWSLDYILTQDVVWMPTETQVRARLGDHFLALDRQDAGFRCTTTAGSFVAETAADAQALALLARLAGS